MMRLTHTLMHQLVQSVYTSSGSAAGLPCDRQSGCAAQPCYDSRMQAHM